MGLTYTEASLRPALGMFSLPYGKRYPELVTKLGKIYDERAAGIPWLPAGWIGQVGALSGGSDAAGNRWILVPAPSGGPLQPAWLNTPDKRQWWDEFARLANSAVGKYAADDAVAGRREIDAAYASAAFWDSAYKIAVVLATPVRVAGAAVGLLTNPITALGLFALVGFVFFARRKR